MVLKGNQKGHHLFREFRGTLPKKASKCQTKPVDFTQNTSRGTAAPSWLGRVGRWGSWGLRCLSKWSEDIDYNTGYGRSAC